MQHNLDVFTYDPLKTIMGKTILILSTNQLLEAMYFLRSLPVFTPTEQSQCIKTTEWQSYSQIAKLNNKT